MPPSTPLIKTQMVQSAPALWFDHNLTWLIVLTAGKLHASLLNIKAKSGYPQKGQNERKEIKMREKQLMTDSCQESFKTVMSYYTYLCGKSYLVIHLAVCIVCLPNSTVNVCFCLDRVVERAGA